MLATYEIVCSRGYDPATSAAVKSLLTVAADKAQGGLSTAGYVPLPEKLKKRLLTAINGDSVTERIPYGREQPTDGETVTTPNPADTGSGGVAAVASSRAAHTPLNWGVVDPSRGDRLFRNLAEGSGALIIV